METFRGRAHLPGGDKEWGIDIDIDWDEKEIYVHIDGAPGGVKTWTGLVPQAFGNYEVAFRTKGIPTVLTHWWHLVRRNGGDMWGIVIGLPNVSGEWTTCLVSLKKVK
jgi:hypothetical protein